MIPEFDEHGYLPAGIHRATLDEIRQRFGTSTEVRRVQMESLLRTSIARIILNGSCVTDEPEPIDIDCVLLTGPRWGSQTEIEAQLDDGLPFITPQIANERAFDDYVGRIFASDRGERAKGMIEVIP